MAYPQNRPSVPQSVSPDEVVAAVIIMHPEIPTGVPDNAFRTTQLIYRRPTRAQTNTAVGAHVYLTRAENKFEYTFGRQTRADSNARNIPDVPLPGTGIAKRLFKLVPDWEANTWRIDSMSTTVYRVNNVPLQKPTQYTRQIRGAFPHVLYLDQSVVNRVVIQDVQIDIWLFRAPREVMTSSTYTADPIEPGLQNVGGRNEDWAQSQYLPSHDQVSGSSWAVLHRFTGQRFTAKLFRANTERLDEEFRMFNRQQVDGSVVRYLQSTRISNIPVIITDSCMNFHSYASQRGNIHDLHPALRFAVATKLLLRLFSALEFLHFHGIVHGSVSRDSVLMHVVDDRVKQVLLVDYSSAKSFSHGEVAPKDAMVADGEAVIQLIDDCCDLWTLREAASAKAQSENVVRKRTQEAARQCQLVDRCCRDFFGARGGLKTSPKGKKLLRLLELKQIEWHSAVAEQTHNAKLREVGYVYKPTLDGMRDDYTRVHGLPSLGKQHIWNLSLGHPYLDGLVNQLHHDHWDLTPRDVRTKVKKIAGDVEDPWKTFGVVLSFDFDGQDHQGDGRLSVLGTHYILLWLAICCEVHPEWSLAILTEATDTLSSTITGIDREELTSLESALLEYGVFPPIMHRVFYRLLRVYNKPLQGRYTVDVTQEVWYHLPSKMFNITQLQRLASPQMLANCVKQGTVKCENFAEVRGSPELEGCYVPMIMLPAFLQGLGLTVKDVPETGMVFPTHDPADFSHVLHHGRVVLARQGLLAYATIVRSGDQCCWHDLPEHGKDFETTDYFLPTYFGDAAILPQLPPGGYHARPEHWSGFANDKGKSKRRSERQILEIKSPAAHAGAYRTVCHTLRVQKIAATELTLATILRERGIIRSAAFPERKFGLTEPVTPSRRVKSRPAASSGVVNSPAEHTPQPLNRSPSPLRSKPRKSQSSPTVGPEQILLGAKTDFVGRLPSIGGRYNQSFTIPDGSFVVDNDWSEVDKMLNEMPAEDSPRTSTGVFGFHINRSMQGSDTEADSPSPLPRLPATAEETTGGPTGELRRYKSTTPHTTLSELVPVDTPKPNPRSAWESFVAKRGPNRQKLHVSTPEKSSTTDLFPDLFPDLPHESSSADGSPGELAPSKQNALAIQSSPSPTLLDLSVQNLPDVVLGNPAGPENGDDALTIPDTESWEEAEPAESVDDETGRT
ncbi:hypothetical protein E8E13_000697 [Curvularia kusanoi]|uniref:Protein kinase domain-containing protein n=1 Tax=Curvularia kusanoi TaxID=90978 RepID=A0A9P4TBV2_CURKU|nr:hypothetical protein E8E13_000697 [Curvularia kusanoi]